MTCTTPFLVKNKEGDIREVPCTRCIACLVNSSQDWSRRITDEMYSMRSDDNCFVTLTFSNDALMTRDCTPYLANSLLLRDVQLFLKRLRSSYDRTIKYFFVGEYAPDTFRPHYHACILGWMPHDGILIDNNLYTSESLHRLWNEGLSSYRPLDVGSIEYVTKYMLKSVGSNEAWLARKVARPFRTMSRNLGKAFALEHGDELFDQDRPMTEHGSVRRLPRFYKKVFDYVGQMSDYQLKRRLMLGETMSLDEVYEALADDSLRRSRDMEVALRNNPR